MKKLSMVYRKVSDLNPATYNPREIEPEAMSGLSSSIKKWNMVQPIVFNVKRKTVVGGHRRLEAAIKNGETEVPVIEVSLNETEEKALNVALNNPKIQGHFTDDLADLLKQIQTNFDVTDFEELKFNDLLTEFDWTSDVSQIDNVTSEVNFQAKQVKTISIDCPIKSYEDVLRLIRDTLRKSKFKNLDVR